MTRGSKSSTAKVTGIKLVHSFEDFKVLPKDFVSSTLESANKDKHPPNVLGLVTKSLSPLWEGWLMAHLPGTPTMTFWTGSQDQTSHPSLIKLKLLL